ncbi:MAG: IS200/IS605 family transposase [Deltaproteobacteria bacterium]
MANTYTSLHYHIVFSTKNRENHIRAEARDRVWAFLGGIARENKMKALCVGGTENHIHILVMTPPAMALSKMVQLLKGGSSKWIHETFPEMRTFAWQDGYGAFTVSKSQVLEVIRYIQGQQEHHRGKSFQEEYLAFLKTHGIEYDDRYVWG